MVKSTATQIQKDRSAEYQRKWRIDNPERWLEINRAGNKKWRSEHHRNYIESKRKYYHGMRLKVQEFFGNKCAECGNTDHRVLQLDHIKGGGERERKNNKRFVRAEYRYKLIQDNPEEMRRRFQLLCANCNWIKRWENHEVAQYSDEE